MRLYIVAQITQAARTLLRCISFLPRIHRQFRKAVPILTNNKVESGISPCYF